MNTVLSAFTHTQKASRVMKKISKKFHSGTELIIAGIALKQDKVGPIFQASIHVLPCHPYSNRRQETKYSLLKISKLDRYACKDTFGLLKT